MAKNKYKQAKEMELDAVEESAEQAVEAVEAAPEQIVKAEEPRKRAEAPKVTFDGWWAARAASIPHVHKKEIIKADFRGQKVPHTATMADFDKALKKYGVVLA